MITESGQFPFKFQNIITFFLNIHITYVCEIVDCDQRKKYFSKIHIQAV